MEIWKKTQGAKDGPENAGGALEREYLAGAKKLSVEIEAAASVEVVQDALQGGGGGGEGKPGPHHGGGTPV